MKSTLAARYRHRVTGEHVTVSDSSAVPPASTTRYHGGRGGGGRLTDWPEFAMTVTCDMWRRRRRHRVLFAWIGRRRAKPDVETWVRGDSYRHRSLDAADRATDVRFSTNRCDHLIAFSVSTTKYSHWWHPSVGLAEHQITSFLEIGLEIGLNDGSV